MQSQSKGERAWPRCAALGVLAVLVAGCGGGSHRAAQVRSGVATQAHNGLDVLPFPGTPAASAQSEIVFPALSRSQLTAISVTGSTSGSHTGSVSSQPQGRGVAFTPDRPFSAGETVSVRASLSSPDAGTASGEPGARQLSFSFTVLRPPTGAAATPKAITAPPGPPPKPPTLQSFHSRPDLKPPVVDVATNSSGTTPGDIFVDPAAAPQNGPLILDDKAQVVWFQPLSGGNWAFNFRKQTYRGQPVLTWFEGHVVMPGYGSGTDMILDRNYRTVAALSGADGFRADLHDFLITPQGTALYTSYSPVQADLSSVGGSKDGTLLDGMIQEVDIATGRLLWEWHAYGHVPIADSYTGKPVAGVPYDFFHINSISVAPDGDLIVSARSTWAIYKINRNTGAIVWEVGGKHSSFKMGSGTQFEWQHDAQLWPDDTLTLFNDAADPKEESQSRAMKLQLDTTNMTASLSRSYTHTPPVLAGSQGNMQTLSGGNVFVGWGAKPNFSEYTQSGQQIFDAAFSGSVQSYRAYRFPWDAQAPGRPTVAVTSQGGGAKTVYASWNGATAVARWQVLAGASPTSLTPLTSSARNGFETAIRVSTKQRYVAVSALDSSGHGLGSSNAVAAGA